MRRLSVLAGMRRHRAASEKLPERTTWTNHREIIQIEHDIAP
jgi:hypothetical protein